MRKAILLALVMTLVSVASPAAAHKQEVADPNDTQGKLDIKKATSIDRGSGPQEKFIFVLKTYDRWRKIDIAGGQGIFRIQFRRGQESSYQIEITADKSNNINAFLVLCIEAQGCDYDNGVPVPVRKRNAKVVKTKVRREQVPGVGRNLKWRGTSAYGSGCSGNC
jgi:hypothetical protein